MSDTSCPVELLVGLGPDVRVISVVPLLFDRLRVTVETTGSAPVCPGCGRRAWVKDRSEVSLIDLNCFGKPVELVWRKRRWQCTNRVCGVGSWVEHSDAITPARSKMTSRAGRWATFQVGRYGRAIAEVADELGCSWHTINSTVVAWGKALLEADTSRVGVTKAVGLDEILHERRGRYRTKNWATTIVDVATGQLIEMVEGRTAGPVITWFETQPETWTDRIRYGVLDLSGAYRKVFNHALSHVRQIADRFHVTQLANRRLDECRRRIQQEQHGHRGRAGDPLYRIRRTLTMGTERLDDSARRRLEAFLASGDPHGEVAALLHAKEAVRQLYEIGHHSNAVEYLEDLVGILIDDTLPPEANTLGRTLRTWAAQVTNWHLGRYSNGPTEGANNRIKRVKRAGYGISRFEHLRIRALLYAGNPNWELLETITPRSIAEHRIAMLVFGTPFAPVGLLALLHDTSVGYNCYGANTRMGSHQLILLTLWSIATGIARSYNDRSVFRVIVIRSAGVGVAVAITVQSRWGAPICGAGGY